MSNFNSPSGVGQSPVNATDPSGAADAGANTKSDLSSLAADAGQATHQVVDTAKQETRSVASEAGRQARKLAGQVRDELRDQAATQQTRVADGLHSTGSAFTKMADGSDDSGYAPQLVRAAGERIDSAADWLGTRDPATVVEDVKRFARRRPGRVPRDRGRRRAARRSRGARARDPIRRHGCSGDRLGIGERVQRPAGSAGARDRPAERDSCRRDAQSGSVIGAGYTLPTEAGDRP